MTATFDTAIVDYGLGNLFSVKNACEAAHLSAVVTSKKEVIRSARSVILPGVGSFGDAMNALAYSGLDKVLKEIVAEGKILFCICLGMQLLMTESQEFGIHKGLNIIEGDVVRLSGADDDGTPIKVPNVGWGRIYSTPAGSEYCQSWSGTILDKIKNNELMYFVHSYFVRPQDQKVILAKSKYGAEEFCSALSYKNIYACQFHPEKSATAGIAIYNNLAKKVKSKSEESISQWVRI